ncbi:MAG: hypothetical protein KDC90_08790 [Ignavibacteriae bacterium]|nr:hypothetical protein [Ignavibacteriota bacterium]
MPILYINCPDDQESSFKILEEVANKKEKDYIIINLPDLLQQNRLNLRMAVNRNLGKHIIIVSPKLEYANIAFKQGFFYFLKSPYTIQDVRNLMARIALHDQKYKELGLNIFITNRGRFRLNFQDLTFAKGQSQNVELHFTKKIEGRISNLESKTSKELFPKLLIYPSIKRLNKYILVNLDNISRIEGLEVRFSSGESLKLTTDSMRTLLDYLLWVD